MISRIDTLRLVRDTAKIEMLCEHIWRSVESWELGMPPDPGLTMELQEQIRKLQILAKDLTHAPGIARERGNIKREEDEIWALKQAQGAHETNGQ